LDVREKRSLAYQTNSSVEGFAEGPAPIVLSAGTQTAKAGLTLQALLEHYQKMGTTPVSQEELDIARRYLSDVFLLRMETVGAIASMTATLGVLGLPDDYYDQYRKLVEAVTVEGMSEVTKRYFEAGHAIAVVAGDAKRLTEPLSHFGPVTIIDPQKEFSVVRVVPKNENAKIELERIDGT
jgi:predicted Zn-dependent peptidase